MGGSDFVWAVWGKDDIDDDMMFLFFILMNTEVLPLKWWTWGEQMLELLIIMYALLFRPTNCVDVDVNEKKKKKKESSSW